MPGVHGLCAYAGSSCSPPAGARACSSVASAEQTLAGCSPPAAVQPAGCVLKAETVSGAATGGAQDKLTPHNAVPQQARQLTVHFKHPIVWAGLQCNGDFNHAEAVTTPSGMHPSGMQPSLCHACGSCIKYTSCVHCAYQIVQQAS